MTWERDPKPPDEKTAQKAEALRVAREQNEDLERKQQERAQFLARLYRERGDRER